MGISIGLLCVPFMSKAQDSVPLTSGHYNGMCFDHVQAFTAQMFSGKVAGI
jgi:hypothetical protein